MSKDSDFYNRSNRTNEWITPKEYTEALGKFSLDPCASVYQKWHHAVENWNILSKPNSLERIWFGKIWLNPPYSENKLWMKKMAKHNNGIALVPARVDTNWFQDYVFNVAASILFLKGRIRFYGKEGHGKSNCTFPPVFIAYGDECSKRLHYVNLNNSLFKGIFISLNPF